MTKLTMTPLQPRTMNGLRGFGFTVSWGEPVTNSNSPEVPDSSEPAAADVGLASPASTAAEQRANTKDAPTAHNDDYRQVPVIGEIR